MLGDQLEADYQREQQHNDRQRDKFGDYTGDDCTNCGRVRVMTGKDGKHRCEKCAWCVEDKGYDHEFSSYLNGS